MAENLCGPSNGAKNLVNHVNRDRSLQQDRMVNGAPGSSHGTFRSQPTHVNGADQAFAGFQNNSHMDPVMGVPPFDEFGHDRLGAPSPIMASRRPAPVAGLFGFAAQQPPDLAMSRPATTAVVAHQGTAAIDWVNQFSSMQLGNTNTQMAAPTMANSQHTRPVFNGAQFNSTGTFAPTFFSLYHDPSHTVTPGVMFGNQNQPAAIQQNESSLDIEAFNRAFGDYDEAEFKDELANWARGKEEVKEEEAVRHDLPQHRPGVVDDAVKKPESAETTGRVRVDEELARAAISILNSVSGNDSEKFKNSNFFELMRRIGNREVVVDGSNLVNAVTGEALVSKEGEKSAETPIVPETSPTA